MVIETYADNEALDGALIGPVRLHQGPEGLVPGEKELGRQLFFDSRLSGDNSMSCASCHQPAKAWADGVARSRGARRQEIKRNSPSLLNLRYHSSLFWDGRIESLDQLALVPIQEVQEMNQDLKGLVVKLNRVPGYVRQFRDVYGPAGITPGNISKAIAAFLKFDLPAGETRFDRFQRDPTALTPLEQRGMRVFVGKARCNLCHAGPAFMDHSFHDIGLKQTPGTDDDVGRYGVVQEERSWRAFRTPSLRHAPRTSPYMHDGSLKSLREVVDFYDRGGDRKQNQDPLMRPLGLRAEEKEALVAFLGALAGPLTPMQAPELPLEAGPRTLEEARDSIRQRLEAISFALHQKDAAGVGAGATAFRETLEHARTLGPPAGCLENLSREAWDLTHRADSARPMPELERGLDRLRAGLEGCLLAAPQAAASVEDLDRVLDEGTAALDRLRNAAAEAGRREAICLKGFSMEELIGDIGTRRFGDLETATIRDSVRQGLLNYFESRSFIDRDPAVCDKFEIPGMYFGIAVSGNILCRQRYYGNILNHAVVTRDPDLLEICQESLRRSFYGLGGKEAAAVCGAVAGDSNSPELCSALIPRFVPSRQMRFCENQFGSLRVLRDPGYCLGFLPEQGQERCLGLQSFRQAYEAGNSELCGSSVLCRAFMVDAARSSEAAADGVRERVCGIIRQAAGERQRSILSELTRLLDHGRDMIPQLRFRGAPLGSREDRLNQLRRQATVAP